MQGKHYTKHNRQFEISAGSRLFFKEGAYGAREKISALHNALHEILLPAEENLKGIKQLLPD